MVVHPPASKPMLVNSHVDPSQIPWRQLLCYFWLRLVIQKLSSYLIMMHASLAYHSKLMLIFYGSFCPLMFLLHQIAGALIDPASPTAWSPSATATYSYTSISDLWLFLPTPHRELIHLHGLLLMGLFPCRLGSSSPFSSKALATLFHWLNIPLAHGFDILTLLLQVFLILGNLIVQLLGPFHQTCLAHRFPKTKLIKKHKGCNQMLNGVLWIDNGWEVFWGTLHQLGPNQKKRFLPIKKHLRPNKSNWP